MEDSCSKNCISGCLLIFMVILGQCWKDDPFIQTEGMSLSADFPTRMLMAHGQIGEVVTTIPTIGFNVESVTYKNLNFNVWVSCLLSRFLRISAYETSGSRWPNFYTTVLEMLLCQYRRGDLRHRLNRYRPVGHRFRRVSRDVERGRVEGCSAIGFREQTRLRRGRKNRCNC